MSTVTDQLDELMREQGEAGIPLGRFEMLGGAVLDTLNRAFGLPLPQLVGCRRLSYGANEVASDWGIEGETRDALLGAVRTLRIEVFEDGQRTSLLILCRLKGRGGWRLGQGLPELGGLREASMIVRGALAVVFCGQVIPPGPRLIRANAPKHHTFDTTRLSHHAGLQLFGHLGKGFDLVGPTFDTAYTTVPETLRPPDTLPDQVKILVDRVGLPPRLDSPQGGVPPAWAQVDLWWAADVQGSTLGAFGLKRQGVSFYLEGGRSAADVSWIGDLDIGGSTDLVVAARTLDTPDGATLRVMSRLDSPVVFAHPLSDVGRLLGVGSEDFSLPIPLPDVPVSLVSFDFAPGQHLAVALTALDPDHAITLGEIRLQGLSYALLREEVPPAHTRHILGASLDLFGLGFEVLCEGGDYIQGSLRSHDGIDLGRVITEILPVELPFDLQHLTLQNAMVRHYLKGGGNELVLALDGVVSLFNGAFFVQNVRLDLNLPGPGSGDTARYAIDVHLVLGGVTIFCLAEHNNGWRFSGRCRPAVAVSLRQLLAPFGDLGDLPDPDGLDVELLELTLSWDSSQNEVSIAAITSWEIDPHVPLLGGKNDVVAEVTVAGGGGGSALSLAWSRTHGDLTLDASASIGRTRKCFAFDINARSRSLFLSGLVNQLELGDALGLPPLPDDLFAVRMFAFNCAVDNSPQVGGQPAGTRLSAALSSPVAGGELLIELNGSSTQRSFRAAWQPEHEGAELHLGALMDSMGETALVGGLLGGLGGGLEELAAEALKQTQTAINHALTFRALGFTWDAAPTGGVVTIHARSALDWLDDATVLLRRGATSELVVALKLRSPTLPAVLTDLPVVGDTLETLVSAIQFSPRVLYVSKLVKPSRLVIPAFDANSLAPAEDADATRALAPLASGPQVLGSGVAVGGSVSFGAPLRSLIHVDTLDGTISVGSGGLSFNAALPGSVNLDLGGAGSLRLANPLVRLAYAGPVLSASVGGDLQLRLFGQMINAGGWLDVSDQMVDGRLAIQGVPLPSPPGLPGVHFTTEKQPFFLSVGMEGTPAALTLGLSGDFFIYTQKQTSNGQATVVMELIEEVPNPVYVGLSVDTLGIPGMIEAVTGVEYALYEAKLATSAARDAVGGPVGESAAVVGRGIEQVRSVLALIEDFVGFFELDDVLLLGSEKAVQLPDGSVASPGVEVRGRLTVLGWHAFVWFKLGRGAAFSLTGHLELEPISLGGVLSLKGDGAGLKTPPKSVAEMQATSKGAASSDHTGWYLAPGGPVLHVSSSKSPFLHASLHATLFGFLSADVTADVTTEGLSFDFKLGAGNVATTELKCLTSFKTGKVEATGKVGVHLQGSVGPILPGIEATRIDLNTGFDASVSLYADASRFEMRLNGSFTFQGLTLTVPEITLTVRFADVAALAEEVWKKIRDCAESIFADVIAPIGKFFSDAAAAVAEVATQSVQAVAEVAEEAAQKVDELKQQTTQALVATAEEVDRQVTQLTAAAEDLWNNKEAVAAAAATAVLDAVHFTELERQAEAAVASAEQLVTDVATTTTQMLTDIATEAQAGVDAARDAVNVLEDGVTSYATQVEHETEVAINVINNAADDLIRGLEDLARAVDGGVEDVVEDVGGWFGI